MTRETTTSTMFHGAGVGTGTGAPSRGFRGDIQALRGIAVLFVVLYHAGVPGFSGGFVGVDVFFVISGFLITPILHDEVVRRETIDFVGFIARRIRRLLPAMAVMLIATGMAGLIVFAPFEHPEFANTLLSCAVYASNLFFAWRQTDYLAGNVSESPLLHTWSLSVEEQFYFLWPILIMLAAWAGRRTGFGVTRSILLAIGASGAISLLLSLWLTDANQPFAFFMMPTRVWEFAAGGAAALLIARGTLPGGPRAASIAVSAALLVLALTTVFLDESVAFPGAAALVPVAATALLLAAGSDGMAGPVGRLMAWRPLQYCGTVSYSFYLWHWPLLVYAEALGLAESLAARLAWVAVSFGFAVASYHWIENPVRHSRALSLKPMRAVTFLVAFSALGGGAALMWKGAADGWQQAPGQRILASAGVTATTLRDRGCVADFAAVDPVACHFGSENANRRIVLFGDSHAAQWFRPLQRMTAQRGWSLTTMIKSACPAAKVAFRYYAVGRRYRECEQWRDAALERIVEERPDLVIVTSSLSYDVGRAAWHEGTDALFSALEEREIAVLHMRDNPRPGFDVPACLSRAAWRGDWGASLNLPAADCRFERPEGPHLDLFAAERTAIAERAGVHGIDLYARICPDAVCPVLAGATPIYRDSNHLTEDYVDMIAGPLEERVEEILAGPISLERNAASSPSADPLASL